MEHGVSNGVAVRAAGLRDVLQLFWVFNEVLLCSPNANLPN